MRDITRTKTPMEAETWAAKLIQLCWDFVLNSWFIRNDVEHNLDNKSNEIAKRKLIERIMWIKTKIDKDIERPYSKSTETDLIKLPSNNLRIMVDQILQDPEESLTRPYLIAHVRAKY
jgi:hypothetical protein